MARLIGLTPEKKEHILSFVAEGLVLGQVARLSKTPKRTLSRWLKWGEEDAENDQKTICAELWLEFEEKRGKEIAMMIKEVRERSRNWQASWELLRAIAKEDFGQEATEYKELLELYQKLNDHLKAIEAKQQPGSNQRGD